MHFNFILDRAWPDNIVYSRLFNRKVDETHYFDRMVDFGDSLQVFYVTADLPVLQSRMLDTGLGSSPAYAEILLKSRIQLDIWNDVVTKMRTEKIKVYTIDNSTDIELAYSKIYEIMKKIKIDNVS